MNAFQLFAHSEEVHTEKTTSLEHLLTNPAVALPLYISINLILFQILRTYKKNLTIPVLLAFNLLVGVLSFSTVPVVSVIAITAGIAMALLISLSLIAGR